MGIPTCSLHSDQRAIGTCVGCRKLVCNLCSTFEGGSELCPSCLPGHRRDRTFKRALLVLLALVAVGVGGAYVVSRRVHVDTSAGAPRFVDHGKYAAEIRSLRETLAQEKCHRSKIVKLGEVLIEAEDPRGALLESQAFFDRCGPHPRLLWVAYSAHKQLSEFQEAVAVAGKLIAEVPDDQDYYWWRGQAYEAGGKLPEAIQDYRQALLLLPTARNIPFDLAGIYERTGQPCEALHVLDQVAQTRPRTLEDPRFKQRLTRLAGAGNCRNLAGEGRATIRFSPHARAIRTVATINGIEGTFLVDTGASLVSLSKSFAAKAGITSSKDQRVMVRTASGLDTMGLALLDRVAIYEAAVERVEGAVMDNDLGDVDGLIGLSYLSRFAIKLDAPRGTLELAPRER